MKSYLFYNKSYQIPKRIQMIGPQLRVTNADATRAAESDSVCTPSPSKKVPWQQGLIFPI